MISGNNKKNSKMRKLTVAVTAMLMCACLLSGCGSGDNMGTMDMDSDMDFQSKEITDVEGGKKTIVCTTFPQYDWMRNILGDHQEDFNLVMLLDSGMDLHSYQPTAEDMSKIADCDLFVYVGGNSDMWVEDALKEPHNENMQAVSLMEVLGSLVKEEEVVEGMQPETEEGEDGEQRDEEPEYDEHVWLSLRNAMKCTTKLAEVMGSIDEENADEYRANGEAYNEKLKALDEKYSGIAEDSENATLLFCDRFPFRYLTEDYGWDYYAAFVGCSAESEASFETIAFLAGKLDELQLPCVLVLEGSDQKIASAVINSANDSSAEIVSVNSLQSITQKDIEAGKTYLSVMEDNLAAFEKALSK